jgi:membrane protein DedA with SNARE-associated domain
MGGVGELGSKDFILLGIVAMAIGALINAFILYFLGFLLTRGFQLPFSTTPKP